MTLSIIQWLKIFDTKEHLSLSVFINSGRVKKSSGTFIPLKQIIQTKDLSQETVKLLYEAFVINKIEYLTNFYNKSLKIPKNTQIIHTCLNNELYPSYKNIIRNKYYKELLLYTKTIQPGISNYLEVILNLFKYNIIDYKLLTPSSIKLIITRRLSNVLSGFYFRASIMNPTIPYSISHHINHNFSVLTPTLGWSSYLIGMLSNTYLKEYVGIDVIKKVCDNTKCIADKHTIKNDIYCVPSEDLYINKSFMTKYKNHFDFIFFSPPYYQLELYHGKQQSTHKYNSYTLWLEGYWRQTIKMCYHTLNNNKLMFFIISGYYLNKKYINLEKDMTSICVQEQFKLVKKIPMGGKNIGFTTHRKSKEIIFVFSKGNVMDTQINYFLKHINSCNNNTRKFKKIL
jgi:hypothetical protein